MNPAPGLVVGSKYRLTRPLGAGGMGTIWLARHEQLEVDVALKLMAEALASSPMALTRFEREAKAAAQLKSPHVVHIHDYGVQGGAPYIVMELLEGEDLDALLGREKRLSPARAAEILTQAARGLRAAHDAGIVHRDLKPSNLFLTRPGGELLVKILDFGIAKETAAPTTPQERTTTGVILGSPLYMSPEQARGGAVGPASDLWSLSVVAFEMITGANPFLGASVGDVIARICGDEVPPPSSLDPSLPPEVDAFFARALMRPPARRFASARELAEAFSAVAARCPERPSPAPLAPPRDPAAATLGRSAPTAPQEAPPPIAAAVTTDPSLGMRLTEPAPEPVPEPTPEPVPERAPEPVPERAPEPVPERAPEPVPRPRPPRRRAAALALLLGAVGTAGYLLATRPVAGVPPLPSATVAALPPPASAPPEPPPPPPPSASAAPSAAPPPSAATAPRPRPTAAPRLLPTAQPSAAPSANPFF